MFNHMVSLKMANQENVGLETFIRQKNLIGEGYAPFSAATLWRAVRAGTFPAPIKIGAGVTCWRLSDVRQWQEAQSGGKGAPR